MTNEMTDKEIEALSDEQIMEILGGVPRDHLIRLVMDRLLNPTDEEEFRNSIISLMVFMTQCARYRVAFEMILTDERVTDLGAVRAISEEALRFANEFSREYVTAICDNPFEIKH